MKVRPDIWHIPLDRYTFQTGQPADGRSGPPPYNREGCPGHLTTDERKDLFAEMEHAIDIRLVIHDPDENQFPFSSRCFPGAIILQIHTIGDHVQLTIRTETPEQSLFRIGDHQAGIKSSGHSLFVLTQPASLTSINQRSRKAGVLGILEPFVGIDIREIDDPPGSPEMGRELSHAGRKNHHQIDGVTPALSSDQSPQTRGCKVRNGQRLPGEQSRQAAPSGSEGRPADHLHRATEAAQGLGRRHLLLRPGQAGQMEMMIPGQMPDQVIGTNPIAFVGRIGHPMCQKENIHEPSIA